MAVWKSYTSQAREYTEYEFADNLSTLPISESL